jgi:hypothetical protein
MAVIYWCFLMDYVSCIPIVSRACHLLVSVMIISALYEV